MPEIESPKPYWACQGRIWMNNINFPWRNLFFKIWKYCLNQEQIEKQCHPRKNQWKWKFQNFMCFNVSGFSFHWLYLGNFLKRFAFDFFWRSNFSFYNQHGSNRITWKNRWFLKIFSLIRRLPALYSCYFYILEFAPFHTDTAHLLTMSRHSNSKTSEL